MEYVEMERTPVNKVGDGMTVPEVKQVAPAPAATVAAPALVQKAPQAIPPIPVYMDDDERFVDFRKPGFWSYTPSVFAAAFGFVLFILFTLGGAFVGFMIGLGILMALMAFVRFRLWKRTGYWFTNLKLVIHDGSRTRLVPYDEIALSSLAFEGQDCMFSTTHIEVNRHPVFLFFFAAKRLFVVRVEIAQIVPA